MKYSIVTRDGIGFHDLDLFYTDTIAMSVENSETKRIWRDTLKNLGLNYEENNISAKDLFEFIKKAYEQHYDIEMDVDYVCQYIASSDGMRSIPHNKAARFFSQEKIVYVDELMLDVLFEYIATTYLWARYGEEEFGFCFPYVFNLLNVCCRQGHLNSDENKSVLLAEVQRLSDDKAICLIEDLYWGMLAFVFCHELAHIYLEHHQIKETNKLEARKIEFEADAVGYDIFLKIIVGEFDNIESPFEKIFHEYVYVAPMLLFLFYGDLYYICSWVFGEEIGDTHPNLEERINKLLEQSEEEKYQFDTNEGNEVLNCLWDVSDYFRREIFLKLKNGKLNSVILKGGLNMSGSGFQEAYEFNKAVCDDLKIYADVYNLEHNRLIGLWNIAFEIEAATDSIENSFVWTNENKTYSTKSFNIKFRPKAIFTAIMENGLTLGKPDTGLQAAMMALFLFYKFLQVSTIQLTEEQAKIMMKCHELKGYEFPVNEEVLIAELGVSRTAIDQLYNLQCIDLINGEIYLKEKVFLKNR